MDKCRYVFLIVLLVFSSVCIYPASRRGKRALLIEDYSRALEIFNKDINKHPDDWEAHSLIGYIYMQEELKDKSKALFHLQKAFELNKKDPVTDLYLFILYVDDGRYGDAQGILSFIDQNDIEKMDEKYLFYLYKGLLYAGQENTEKAEEMIIEAIKLEPACGLCRKHLGLIYYNNDDYANADAVLSRAIGFFPDDKEINKALADIFLSEEYFRPTSARLHIDKLKSVTSEKDMDILLLEGRYLQLTGNFKQAVEVYKKASMIDEDNCEVNISLADLYQKRETQNLSLSKKHLNRVLEKCKGHEDLHMLLANYYYNINEPKKAVSEYQDHLAKYPDDTLAMVKLALIYLQKPLQNPGKTIELGLKALSVNSSYLPAVRILSTAYFLTNDFKNAKKYIEQALSISPNDSEMLGYLACIYFSGKEYSKAKEYALSAVRNAGNNIRALSVLGEIAYSEKDYQKAIGYLQNIIHYKRNDYRASLLLAYIYQEPGFTDYRKSYHFAEIALKQNESDANTWKLLGNAYMNDRMLSKALDAFENSLLYNPNDSWVKAQVADLKRRLGKE